jgi:hypothetical protein
MTQRLEGNIALLASPCPLRVNSKTVPNYLIMYVDVLLPNK